MPMSIWGPVDSAFTAATETPSENTSRSGAVNNTIDSPRHFKQCSVTETPLVVIMGDSIATDTPTTTFDETDSLWGQLQRAIVRSNPSLTFTFENRAIGGSTWTNANPSTLLNTTGLTLPSWAGAGTDSWLTIVEAMTPDMLILAWGMNDRENFVTAQFRAVVQEILSWTKVPDIVFINTMVPNRYSSDATISSDVSQNGRLFNAHYIRTWAAYNGFPCIDLNRQYCKIVQGFDPRSTYFTGTASATSQIIPYTAPETQQDFGIEIVTTASAALWSGKRIKLTTSYQGPNGGSWLELYDDAGFLAVEFVAIDDGPGRYLQYTSAVVTPTAGSINIKIFIKDDWVRITLGTSVVFEGLIYRHGGTYSPILSVTSGTVGPWNIRTWIAIWVPNNPALNDYELWGSTDTSASVEGGNDLNHPTSKGAAFIYRDLFDAQDWRIPVAIIGNTLYPLSTERKIGIGTTAPKGFLHITKTAATAFNPDGNANNLVIEDATQPGMTFGMNAGGAVRIRFGTPASPDHAGITWVESTNEFTVRTADLSGFVVIPPGVDTLAGIQCLVNIAGVTTLRQVSVGAADSGGVGFRLLRVPN